MEKKEGGIEALRGTLVEIFGEENVVVINTTKYGFEWRYEITIYWFMFTDEHLQRIEETIRRTDLRLVGWEIEHSGADNTLILTLFVA